MGGLAWEDEEVHSGCDLSLDLVIIELEFLGNGTITSAIVKDPEKASRASVMEMF